MRLARAWPPIAAALAACGLLAALAACTGAPPRAAQVWLTTGDQTQLLARQPDAAFSAAEAAGAVIEIDPEQRFQSIVGFGASFTDASSYLLQRRMSEAQRTALLEELFGAEGIGLSLTRLTIGASDFSQTHYTYDDVAAGRTDPTLQHFSLAPARENVIPSVKQALAINPSLAVMASPWSAPAWMKTSRSLIGGALAPAHYGDFAAYLSRYVQEMEAEGVPIFAVTAQNEPHFVPGDYPGMRLEARERAAFIGAHLGPKFQSEGLATRILDYDHNWDLPASPLAVLGDAQAAPYVHGVAWHCYGGEVSAQSQVHEAFADKEVYMTECSGGDWAPDWAESFSWQISNLVIGATRNWARGVVLWNLALDENSGPHLGGCTDCRGVVTVDSQTGAVRRNLEYYALGHASKFVRPGAVRIGAEAPAATPAVAFQNPDGAIVLLAANPETAAAPLQVRYGGAAFGFTLPPRSAVTFVWDP